jgi:hypothetical protein
VFFCSVRLEADFVSARNKRKRLVRFREVSFHGFAAVTFHGFVAVTFHGFAAVTFHGFVAVTFHGLVAVTFHGFVAVTFCYFARFPECAAAAKWPDRPNDRHKNPTFCSNFPRADSPEGKCDKEIEARFPKVLAAWCSRHRIRLGNKIPWFESRRGIRFIRKSWQCCCVCTIDLTCIVCVLTKRNKGIWPQKMFK